MNVTQRDSGLRPEIQRDGCLFLVYQWIGWLAEVILLLGNSVRGSSLVEEGPPAPGGLALGAGTDTPAALNARYGHLVGAGAIDAGTDEVRDPVAVVRSGRGVLHHEVIAVDRVGAHQIPALSAGVPPSIPTGSDLVLYAVEWKRDQGKHQHFVGLCAWPPAYFDPLVISQTRLHGYVDSARRVTFKDGLR